ncbi:hypothetical protein [Maricaulis sp.]|uniref:hypothetical protein n=1 Tax=Maricaulis sp. TaxID=1486257 RepID=UPI002B275627|nr:hypothetical protein [Maricaulis sp.]
MSLIDGGSVVEIRASGQATRREAGWATERARELSQQQGVIAILADCSDAEQQDSPKLSAEIIENFLFALERPLSCALVMPGAWDEPYLAAVLREIVECPEHTRFFRTRDEALSWLTVRQSA